MKRFIETLKNIWNIEDLRYKILLTLGMVLIYRVGTYVVLPGIDPTALAKLEEQGSSGILGFINVFSGGAFSNASIFALGIMPYISASIAVQLLGLAIPYFQKLQREGESGRRQINQITRYLTVAVTTIQGFAYIANLKVTAGNSIMIPMSLFSISTVVCLSAGTLFVMWLGEKITDKGLGNGISLIIMVGIIARLPNSIAKELASRFTAGDIFVFVFELAFWILIIMGTILLIQGTRKIPVHYAKRNIVQGGRVMQAGGNRQFLPLKLNQAGVMPIIFAQALMFLPATIAQFFPNSQNDILNAFTNNRGFWYNFVVFMLIIIFTYFYTALIINPNQMADDMKKNGGFIPGVKPGKKTSEYIDNVMSRITLPGAVFLGLIAILPAIIMLFNVNDEFAYFFGGTSLLIMVGSVLDTLQQIESHLMMRKYDGLTKGGKIKGRQASVGGI